MASAIETELMFLPGSQKGMVRPDVRDSVGSARAPPAAGRKRLRKKFMEAFPHDSKRVENFSPSCNYVGNIKYFRLELRFAL
jgi:hypothetical protein